MTDDRAPAVEACMREEGIPKPGFLHQTSTAALEAENVWADTMSTLHGQLRDSIAELRTHLSRNRDHTMSYALKMIDAVISDGETRARLALAMEKNDAE